MNLPSFKIGRRGRILFAVGLLLLWMIIRHRFFEMDDRFFYSSLLGVKALVLYEVGDYSGAGEAYRTELQNSHSTERTAGDPAWNALLQRDFRTAKQLSQKALDKDSTDVGSLLTLGEIELEEGAFDRALGFFSRILHQETDQFDALLLSSVAYARSGEYNHAIDSLNRALRHNQMERRITSFLQALKTAGDLARLPKGKKPLCLMAHYYRYFRIVDPANGRLAIWYAKSAIRAGDRPDAAYMTMGIVNFKEGKEEKALSAFGRAIEANPRNAEPYRRAAEVYSNRGDLVREYQMMKASYENGSTDSFYLDRFTWFLTETLGDYYQALSLNQKFLETHPEDATALEWTGYLYRYLGNTEQGMTYYLKALSLKPKNPFLYSALGDALLDLGRLEEAESAYRTSLTLGPYRPEPHVGLGGIYERRRSYREAITQYEQAIRLGVTGNSPRIQLCSLYHSVSEFERAAGCLYRALAIDPRNKSAEHLLSYTLQNIEKRGSNK
jgi:tetratricopeptide (TPR) repeat protein